MKKLIGLFTIMLLICGCGNSKLTNGTLDGYKYEEVDTVTNYVKIVTNDNKIMLAELYPEDAPKTVENFQNLVKDKYYDGTIFHRVVKDFVIQAGGFSSAGLLKEVSPIEGEFASNGITNNIKHDEGVLSMARADDKNSASSQFFICVNTNDQISYLDGNYAAFGKVIAGYDVALDISKVDVDVYDKPVKDIIIKSIRFVKIEK